MTTERTESSESDAVDRIEKLLREAPAPYDPDQSLRRVLAQARRNTTTRDFVSFFVSWIWLLFAGFGASMHGAHTRLQQQQPAPRRSRAAQPRPRRSRVIPAQSIPPQQE